MGDRVFSIIDKLANTLFGAGMLLGCISFPWKYCMIHVLTVIAQSSQTGILIESLLTGKLVIQNLKILKYS